MLQSLKWNLKNKFKKRLSVQKAHDFWRNPTKRNKPNFYQEGLAKSEFLFEYIKKYVSESASILELGCNIGRNLNYLHQNGYKNLNAIEINENAIKLMWETYPHLKDVSIKCGSLEEILPNSKEKYDLIYTMAVLEHVHYKSEFIFELIAKATKFLITIEEETSISKRHFPRNYKKVFEKLGATQISEVNLGNNSKEFGKINGDMVCRIFRMI